MKKAVQFGAGNIGRGFLAQLFNQSGYEVVLVEAVPEIIKEINRRGKYVLRIAGGNRRDIVIGNIRAVDASDAQAVAGELADADIAATAVGVNVLKNVAPLIAGGIKRRAANSAGWR
mgnify:CR=1 FL=1